LFLLVDKSKVWGLKVCDAFPGETENVEVLNGALFMTQNAAVASQAITFQNRLFPLVVPIPKPEPFTQSTGHILGAE